MRSFRSPTYSPKISGLASTDNLVSGAPRIASYHNSDIHGSQNDHSKREGLASGEGHETGSTGRNAPSTGWKLHGLHIHD